MGYVSSPCHSHCIERTQAVAVVVVTTGHSISPRYPRAACAIGIAFAKDCSGSPIEGAVGPKREHEST